MAGASVEAAFPLGDVYNTSKPGKYDVRMLTQMVGQGVAVVARDGDLDELSASDGPPRKSEPQIGAHLRRLLWG